MVNFICLTDDSETKRIKSKIGILGDIKWAAMKDTVYAAEARIIVILHDIC